MSLNPFTRIAKLEERVEILTNQLVHANKQIAMIQTASPWVASTKLPSVAELDKNVFPDWDREARLAKKREYNAAYRKRSRAKAKAREYSRAYYARKKAEKDAAK
jgi:hypothetical protein